MTSQICSLTEPQGSLRTAVGGGRVQTTPGTIRSGGACSPPAVSIPRGSGLAQPCRCLHGWERLRNGGRLGRPLLGPASSRFFFFLTVLVNGQRARRSSRRRAITHRLDRYSSRHIVLLSLVVVVVIAYHNHCRIALTAGTAREWARRTHPSVGPLYRSAYQNHCGWSQQWSS